MAKQRSTGSEDNKVTGIASMIGAVLTAPMTMVAKAWNAIMADGVIAGFARQGIDELGTALKAFPDSIQREETGTLWSPTQAEITASRKHGGINNGLGADQRHPWPSEIADRNRHQSWRDDGHDNGHDDGHSM